MHFKRLSRNQEMRSGALAIEFAFTLPILFLFVFASIELCHANMVVHVTESAAYEGARVGIVPGATASEAVTAAEQLLELSKVRGAQISITPGSLQTASQQISMQITVPYNQNTLLAPRFIFGFVVNRTCTLTRE
ncbi:MAG TPA: hypothetical protein DDW52_00480 [Planctomycetaceae bacterium]|nr:hypothetical protein [Planctomycetaceae bacterium]